MNNTIKANADLNRRSENENTQGTGFQSMICKFGSELPGCQREKGYNGYHVSMERTIVLEGKPGASRHLNLKIVSLMDSRMELCFSMCRPRPSGGRKRTPQQSQAD